MCSSKFDSGAQQVRKADYRKCQIMNLPPSQVLFVEDDPKMPEVLAGLLHEANITVIHAPNAAAALQSVRESRLDLVLLDLGLPGMNGFDLLRRLKEAPET